MNLQQGFIHCFEPKLSTYVKYPQEKYGISREEFFNKIRNNELIFCLLLKEYASIVLPLNEYQEELRKGNVLELYPLS